MSRAFDHVRSPDTKRKALRDLKVLPFGVFQQKFGITWPPGNTALSIGSDLIFDLFRLAAAHVPLDEKFYLATHPDVVEAISLGRFDNAQHHYETFGFFEGRQPYKIVVDEEYYLRTNPDIGQNIKDGGEESAQSHFERYGLKEGRLPSANFSLFTLSDK